MDKRKRDKAVSKAVRQVNAGKPYKIESELAGKLEDLIHEYDGIIGVAAVLGVLDIIKASVLDSAD